MVTAFALANDAIRPQQLGITPDRAIGVDGRASERRRKFRSDLVRTYGPRGMQGQNELLDQLSRAMYNDATPEVVRMGAEHWTARTFGWTQRLLDSSSTFGGNIIPRVDIEDYFYALFVIKFPWWERIRNGQANGLSHTWNIVSSSGQASVTDANLTIATDTTVAPPDTGQYAQKQTSNIATLLAQRGISFKEQLATAASGMTYNPETREIENGVIRLKDAAQRLLLQGNQTQAGGTATNEFGAFNANGFDGFRMITGGIGAYNANAVRVDQDKLNKTIVQAINTGTARVENNGGNSSLAVLSATAEAAIMDEQEGKQRVMGSAELIPGVRVNAINTQAGTIPLVSVPGLNAGGHYLRTSDAQDVEDIYVIDEGTVTRRWLGSPDINVLELPAGVSGALTRTFLIFHFITLEVADLGLWQCKVRVPQTLF